jgi:nucleoside-diphosphate-sugar epimerase
MKPGMFKEVILLDNFATQRYCSLFDLPEGVPFRFIEEDICSTDLDKYFNGVDVVVHMAAITNAEGSFEIKDEVEKVNYGGTKKVADACKKNGCKMLFFSTTSVYGNQASIVTEDCPDNRLSPQSPYADSKLRAEKSLKEIGERSGLRFSICRFGTIFGYSPGMRFHTAVNKFVWQACLGKPITVWRTALHQKRPYLCVNDAARAIRFVIDNNIFENQVYNVLTENYTVSNIVDAIKEFIPQIQVELVDSKIMNQLSYTVSSDKFTDLGFRFEGNLKQSLGKCIAKLKAINQFNIH